MRGPAAAWVMRSGGGLCRSFASDADRVWFGSHDAWYTGEHGVSPPVRGVNEGEAIIIALRLLVPLLIFRYPLAGGLAAMLLDGLDVVLIELIPGGSFGSHYHTLDKLLDSYYLTIELIVALRWTSPYARLPAILLFAYRAIGVVLFEVTQRRLLLFIFPNLFENWWLYCVIVERFWSRVYPRSLRTTLIPLVLLLIPKMVQEYLLHFAEAKPWDWIKRNVLGTT